VPVSCGFTLVEVAAAMFVTTVAVLALAQLLVTAARAQAEAAATTAAVALARDKMDELRGLAWGFDAAGAPTADSTSDLVRSLPSGGRGLTESPEDSLDRDTEGYCDYIGEGGVRLGGAPRPAGAAFVRRWRVRADSLDPRNVIDFRVAVVPLTGVWALGRAQGRLPGHAALRTLVARKVPL
jgi:hypothetical protein